MGVGNQVSLPDLSQTEVNRYRFLALALYLVPDASWVIEDVAFLESHLVHLIPQDFVPLVDVNALKGKVYLSLFLEVSALGVVRSVAKQRVLKARASEAPSL